MINSLNQFKIKLQQKNIIVLNGNVYDTFVLNEVQSFKIKKIDSIISDYASELGFENVIKFSPSMGRRVILGEDNNTEANMSEEPNFETLDMFLESVQSEINDKEIPRAIYVVDFSDSYFQTGTTSPEIINPLVKLLSSILDESRVNINQVALLNKQSKVIFLTRDDGNLLKDLTNKNIEYSSVTVNKPNIDERRFIFEKAAVVFNINNREKIITKNSKEHEEAVALTDKMSCKEILQLGRIESMGTELSFKEIYNIAQFNKKDSEWSKLDSKKLATLQVELEKRVLGQEYAINRVRETLISSFLGLNGVLHNENLIKPKGILFFAGPTGVGKTELSKAIASFVFGDETKLIRFDMSEYSAEHSDQRLIGAPPGYVGYDNGGELTNAIKENPFSILLFDEIEKANGKILDKFLQILEDGRLTSSKGELVDFSETFIVFTSNIGANSVDPDENKINVRTKFLKSVEKFFKEELRRPELLNRIGYKNIVPFNFITDSDIIEKIVSNKINKLALKMNKKFNVKINLPADKITLLSQLIESTYKRQMGGRGIVNEIDDLVIGSLSDFVFSNYEKINADKEQDKITNVNLKVLKDKVEFDFE